DVRRRRAGAEVAPAADVAVAEVAFVWLVDEAHQDRIRNHAADDAAGPQRRAGADVGQRRDPRVLADVARALQHRIGTDGAAARYNDRPARAVQHRARREL